MYGNSNGYSNGYNGVYANQNAGVFALSNTGTKIQSEKQLAGFC